MSGSRRDIRIRRAAVRRGRLRAVRRGRRRRHSACALLAALLAVLAGSGTARANVPKHHFVFAVTANITVADPGAIAVNPATNTIYVPFTQNGTDVVLVLDGFSGGAYASVPVPGASNVAVNSMTHTAYVSDSGSTSTVTVISRVWV